MTQSIRSLAIFHFIHYNLSSLYIPLFITYRHSNRCVNHLEWMLKNIEIWGSAAIIFKSYKWIFIDIVNMPETCVSPKWFLFLWWKYIQRLFRIGDTYNACAYTYTWSLKHMMNRYNSKYGFKFMVFESSVTYACWLIQWKLKPYNLF